MPWIVLFTALWLAVVAETVMVLGLSRRLTALQSAGASVPGASSSTIGAVPAGTRLPPAALERLAIRSDSARARSSVILFLSPGCGPCERLADDLKRPGLGDAVGDEFEIVVVTNDAGARRFGDVGRVVVDRSGTLMESLGVPGTPFALGLDSQRIIRGVAIPTNIDDLRTLAEATGPAQYHPVTGLDWTGLDWTRPPAECRSSASRPPP